MRKLGPRELVSSVQAHPSDLVQSQAHPKHENGALKILCLSDRGFN